MSALGFQGDLDFRMDKYQTLQNIVEDTYSVVFKAKHREHGTILDLKTCALLICIFSVVVEITLTRRQNKGGRGVGGEQTGAGLRASEKSTENTVAPVVFLCILVLELLKSCNVTPTRHTYNHAP